MTATPTNNVENELVRVTISASTLAIPLSGGKPGVEHYVERLLSWAELDQQSWISVNTSKNAYGVLYEDNLCPDYETLKQLWKKIGIERYAWRDVSVQIQELMSRGPYFEECLGISPDTVEHISAQELETDPDIFSGCPGDHVKDDLKRCVVLMMISQLSRQESRKPPYHFLSLKESTTATIKASARVAGAIDSIDAISIVDNIWVADDSRTVSMNIDEAELLLHATTQQDLLAVISIALHKQHHSSTVLLEYVVGRAYIASLQGRLQKRPDIARPIIRAMVETLMKSNMSATHALRKGKSGGSATRTRGKDGAEAWRRDIDRDHHLHYWKINGEIEFACISYPHDSFDIPEE